jgi:hypothetical protein
MNKLKQQILSIEPKDTDYEAANKELDFNIKKYNFRERKYYANYILFFTVACFAAIMALVLVTAICASKGVKFLDTSVLIALIGLLGTNIIGVLVIIVKYLFKGD